ncbi:MAG: redoxin domain-containing protein, partial [Woeseiaceae bacterium]
MSGLKPNTKVPDLEVETAGGEIWRLADQKPETFALIEFYRGYHCPRCRQHLIDLQAKLDRFAERGVQ